MRKIMAIAGSLTVACSVSLLPLAGAEAAPAPHASATSGKPCSVEFSSHRLGHAFSLVSHASTRTSC